MTCLSKFFLNPTQLIDLIFSKYVQNMVIYRPLSRWIKYLFSVSMCKKMNLFHDFFIVFDPGTVMQSIKKSPNLSHSGPI